MVLAPEDLDLLELVRVAEQGLELQIRLDKSHDAPHVTLLDAENTPLARASLGARDARGWVSVTHLEHLRPLAPVPGPLGTGRVRAGALAGRHVTVTSRMPTRSELTAGGPTWLVLAPRGPDRVARAAVVGLRSALDREGYAGEVLVAPAWRGGPGVLRPVQITSGVDLVAAATGAVVDDVLEATPDGDELAVVRTALAAAYPEPAVPVLLPPRARGRGAVVLFSGLSGSGKSTLARATAARLGAQDAREVTLLDGDEVRQMLSAGLGFDRRSRELNVSRIGYVASLVARHGGIALAAPIAPFAETRAEVRAMVEPVSTFLLVHVATPLEVCEARDRKGLYARARAGEIPEFTGISSPYEEPTDADVVVDTSALDVEAAVDEVLSALRAKEGRLDEGAYPATGLTDPEPHQDEERG